MSHHQPAADASRPVQAQVHQRDTKWAVVDSHTERDPLLERNVNEVPATEGDAGDVKNSSLPEGFRFAIVFASVLMGDFFVGYDTSCVATLTPVISDEFQAINDVGWYGIAYILALASTVMIFGQIYTFYSMKAVYLICFLVFAVGSAISAAASSSAVFIIGRAITGFGSAGILSGGGIILANTTSLKYRPIYQAISGGMECTALAFGPLIAGAIAHGTSWRLAFYTIIPVAAFIILAIGFFVRNLPQPKHANYDARHQFHRLDLFGFLLFLPTNICLILALQWGGTIYEWGDGTIIALLVLAGIFTLAFIFAQHRKGNTAMFPLPLLKHRSVSLGAISLFCASGSMFVFAFYLPIYFQAIKGASTLDSGVMYMPSAGSYAIAILCSGSITSFIGYWTPAMAIGLVLQSVGAGLLTTFRLDTPGVEWICYQILYGIGAGLSALQSYTAVQTLLPEDLVATALVCLHFVQTLGGIVALAVSQNVFLTRVTYRLANLIPNLDPKAIANQGILALLNSLPPEYRHGANEAYMASIVDVFYIGVVLSCLTSCSLGIEWKSVKQEKDVGEENATETLNPTDERQNH